MIFVDIKKPWANGPGAVEKFRVAKVVEPGCPQYIVGMSRHDLTDEQWAVIEPLIPQQKSGPGRKRNDDRQTLNGILFVLKTGCAWEDVPRRFGSPATC
jgi:hypothetical protein